MSNPGTLEFDGERYIPGTLGNIELEHLHRYLIASTLCAGKSVLDIASGEGYGSAMLAEQALSVIGIDISDEAVAHAQQRYRGANLQYRQGDCTAIPLPDACVDVVVSFETIEHHDKHAEMMAELRRVLKPGGVLLISSPDRYFYSEKPGTPNPHHVKELYAHEFKALVEGCFRHVRYYGQTVAYGSVVFAESTPANQETYWKDDGVLQRADGLAMPLFWLALASDADLPPLPAGLFQQPIDEAELVQLKQRDLDNAAVMLRDGRRFLAEAADTLRQKDEHLGQAADLLRQKDELLQHKDEQLSQAADLLRQKDEHLGQAADLLRQKDEHLNHAADVLRQKDEQLQQTHEQLVQANALITVLKRPLGFLGYWFNTFVKALKRN